MLSHGVGAQKNPEQTADYQSEKHVNGRRQQKIQSPMKNVRQKYQHQSNLQIILVHAPGQS
jgi:hypothetical protein